METDERRQTVNIEKICDAYSARDDAALLKALEEFRRQLSDDVYTVGPAATAMLLREAHLLGILNKTAAEAEDKQGGSLALVVGHLSAYIHYVELIADRERVTSMVARLSDLPNADLTNFFLRHTFVQGGLRREQLVYAAARFAKVKDVLARSRFRQLLGMKMIEPIKVYESLEAQAEDQAVLHYQITHLGEAVLHRLMHPYELPLWCVDEAAFDPEMRAAMRDEIKRAWPSDEQ
jgi:hypothetical protein